MKKAAIIAGFVATAVAALIGGFVVMVRMRGGISAESGLCRFPLVGGLLAAAPADTDEDALELGEIVPQLADDRQVPFLRFGPEAELERLIDQLKVERAEIHTAMRKQKRRSRELDAWERQLVEEREALRERFGKEKAELGSLKEELARLDAALSTREILIVQAEASNLDQIAKIYAKMEPVQAAAVLAQMYSSGEEELVVKVVHLMQDRSAAKVLEAMTDPLLSAQITEKLRTVRQDESKGA